MTTQTEHTEQPLPAVNDRPSIQSLVRGDLEVREQIGIERYRTALQPFNGRDGYRDAYEEAMDLTVYLRQLITERAIALAHDLNGWEVTGAGDGVHMTDFSFGRILTPDIAEALGHQFLEAARNARQAGAR